MSASDDPPVSATQSVKSVGGGIGTACWAEGAVPVTVSGGIGGAAESVEDGAATGGAVPALDWAGVSGAAATPIDNRMVGNQGNKRFIAGVQVVQLPPFYSGPSRDARY